MRRRRRRHRRRRGVGRRGAGVAVGPGVELGGRLGQGAGGRRRSPAGPGRARRTAARRRARPARTVPRPRRAGPSSAAISSARTASSRFASVRLRAQAIAVVAPRPAAARAPASASARLEVGDPFLGLAAGLPLAVEVRARPGGLLLGRPPRVVGPTGCDERGVELPAGLLEAAGQVGVGVGLRPCVDQRGELVAPSPSGRLSHSQPARPDPRLVDRLGDPAPERVVVLDGPPGGVERLRVQPAEPDDRPQAAAAPGPVAPRSPRRGRPRRPPRARGAAAGRAPGSGAVRLDHRLGHRLDRTARAAPAAAHRLDRLVEHHLVLHRQLAAHRVVVERLRAPAGGDVEAGEVPARAAAVARRSTASAVTPRSYRRPWSPGPAGTNSCTGEHQFVYGGAPWR